MKKRESKKLLKSVILASTVVTFMMLTMNLTLYFLMDQTSTLKKIGFWTYEESAKLRNNYYVELSNNLHQDKYVLNISMECYNNETRALCVYDKIPFVYNDSRAEENPRGFLSPEYIMQKGTGVCRDIAVFRKSVFDMLKMNSTYIFQPNHVYVKVFEGNLTYRLDNSCILLKNGTDYNLITCRD